MPEEQNFASFYPITFSGSPVVRDRKTSRDASLFSSTLIETPDSFSPHHGSMAQHNNSNLRLSFVSTTSCNPPALPYVHPAPSYSASGLSSSDGVRTHMTSPNVMMVVPQQTTPPTVGHPATVSSASSPMSGSFQTPSVVSPTTLALRPAPSPMDSRGPAPPKDGPGYQFHSLQQLLVGRNVYVATLPPTFTTAQLRALFSRFGPIDSCTAKMDTDGKCRGFGFVLFATEDGARRAIQEGNGILSLDGVHRLQIRYSHCAALPSGMHPSTMRPPPPPVAAPMATTVVAPAPQQVMYCVPQQPPQPTVPVQHLQPQPQSVYYVQPQAQTSVMQPSVPQPVPLQRASPVQQHATAPQQPQAVFVQDANGAMVFAGYCNM